MRVTKLGCGTLVTAEVIKLTGDPIERLNGDPIGIDILIHNIGPKPPTEFYIANFALDEAVDFLQKAREDYLEAAEDYREGEKLKCSS